MRELMDALKANWKGYEVLQAKAKNRAPKYGRDDDEADALGREVMQLWCDATWCPSTKSTGR
jgi:formate C-acetyltransferase